MKIRRKLYFRATIPHHFTRGEIKSDITLDPAGYLGERRLSLPIRHLDILVSLFRKFLKYISREIKLSFFAAVVMLSTTLFGS